MNLLGELKTALYRKPKDELRRLFAWGPRGYFCESRWKEEMEEAAKRLPPLPASEQREIRNIHYLCGREHWYQAAFCAWSYQQHSRYRIRPVVIDDGTMDNEVEGWFRGVFADLVIRSKSDCDAKMEAELPISKFPNVHACRNRQILFRKLTDIFSSDDEWRLLFDADMLFFDAPADIDAVLQKGSGAMVQRDCWETYGYSRRLTESLTGLPLPEAINIGMLFYKGSLIDWDRVEHWLGVLEEKEGRPYNVTQCISAMLLAGQELNILDKHKYRVHPTSPQELAPGRIGEHYVDNSKPWYYHDAWRLALSRSTGNAGSDPPSRQKGDCSGNKKRVNSRLVSLGSIAYHAYHRPKGLLKKSLREGGPIEQWKTERGRREMEAAAWRLAASGGPKDEESKRQPSGARQVASTTNGLKDQETVGGPGLESGQEADRGKPIEIHMLVGRRFWFMAAFALASLQRQLDRSLHVHFYDDGTLEPQQGKRLLVAAHMVTLHTRSEVDARIERELPETKFPHIRERLRSYPNLKKLTDPHVGNHGPKVVMDADVLFFRRPDETLDWLEHPEGILCATDMMESYGYTRDLMERLAGGPVPELINVGLTGLHSESLDWELLEHWCGELIRREKMSYYLEQALIAMLCARRDFTQLPRSRYLTGPSERQVLERDGVMQHYVDMSKKEYFRSAWRQFADCN